MYEKIGYFKRREVLKHSNFLDLTPLPQHQHELEEEGTVRVLIPRFRGKLSGKLLQPRLKSPYIKLSLDELGSAVWLACDGQKNVRTICHEMREKLGEKIEPAEDRITRFLSQLYNQDLLIFREIIK
ncbi:MAG: PqqD family protein [Bacteroides sp.]|jgi:hypothetical protein|nr:PqqD family protein [Bacteroides sp.]